MDSRPQQDSALFLSTITPSAQWTQCPSIAGRHVTNAKIKGCILNRCQQTGWEEWGHLEVSYVMSGQVVIAHICYWYLDYRFSFLRLMNCSVIIKNYILLSLMSSTKSTSSDLIIALMHMAVKLRKPTTKKCSISKTLWFVHVKAESVESWRMRVIGMLGVGVTAGMDMKGHQCQEPGSATRFRHCELVLDTHLSSQVQQCPIVSFCLFFWVWSKWKCKNKRFFSVRSETC